MQLRSRSFLQSISSRWSDFTTCAGAVKAFVITPANVDDRLGLEDLSSTLRAGSVILVDKGYLSLSLAEDLKTPGQKLLTLKRKNARQAYSPTLQEEIFGRCRLSVSWLIAGLCDRLLTKFLAFNLCFLLAQLSRIKSLIF